MGRAVRPMVLVYTGIAVSPDDGAQVQALLRAKYPVQKRALDGYTRLRRRGRPVSRPASVHLGISVAD